MTSEFLVLLNRVVDAVADAFATVTDFGPSGNRRGQYALDVVANNAALDVLRGAGVGVLSEESVFEPGDGDVVVVIDPIDGSTNASRGIPYFATAVCAVEGGAPVAAVVRNQATGQRYSAELGCGAWCDGRRIEPTGCRAISDAIVGFNSWPPATLGVDQFRVFGAAALDLCAVASGGLDAYVDCDTDAHGVWDYLASVLICQEAGVEVIDARGRNLVVLDQHERRTPVAAATPQLLDSIRRELQLGN